MSSYGFNCTQLSYLTGFAPMVECVYRDSGLADDDDESGDSKMRANETVVLGAHFDSRGVRPTVSFPHTPYSIMRGRGFPRQSIARGTEAYETPLARRGATQSFGYSTAPGADDDASGTSLVLAVARQIWQHRLQFSRKLGEVLLRLVHQSAQSPPADRSPRFVQSSLSSVVRSKACSARPTMRKSSVLRARTCS